MDKKTLWRITKTLLKILVTGAALSWVFSKIDINDFREALSNSNPLVLFLAFLAYCCSVVIASFRLNGYFKNIGLRLTQRYNFKLYLLGLFYNLFLPGGIGGDGYKIYFLRKKFDVKGRKLFSAVFFDRLSGLWALSIIIAALIIFLPQLNIPRELPVIGVVVATASYYFVIKKFFSDFSRGFAMSHLRALGVQSMQVVCAILLLYALGFEGKFSPYLFLFLLSSLVAVIPFTVGGLGARELVQVAGAEWFGMDVHLALIVSLLFYLTSALLALSGAYFIFRPKGLGEERLPTTAEAEAGIDRHKKEKTQDL